MLKVKEDVTRERDNLLKEVASMREHMEKVTASQQKAENDIEQAELKITEVSTVKEIPYIVIIFLLLISWLYP